MSRGSFPGKARGFFKEGDVVIVLTGWRPGSGYTNTMRVVLVAWTANGLLCFLPPLSSIFHSSPPRSPPQLKALLIQLTVTPWTTQAVLKLQMKHLWQKSCFGPEWRLDPYISTSRLHSFHILSHQSAGPQMLTSWPETAVFIHSKMCINKG